MSILSSNSAGIIVPIQENHLVHNGFELLEHVKHDILFTHRHYGKNEIHKEWYNSQKDIYIIQIQQIINGEIENTFKIYNKPFVKHIYTLKDLLENMKTLQEQEKITQLKLSL